MIPEQLPVGPLIELGDPDAVLVRLDVFRHDVHGNFTKVQVGADSGCSGDAHSVQHIQDDGSGQLPGRHMVGVQVVGDVHHHLINGIDNHIFLRHVFQVHFVNAGAVLDIESHSGGRHDVVEALLWVSLGHNIVIATMKKDMAWDLSAALRINGLYLLDDLEQPGSSRDTVGFQGGADSNSAFFE